MGRILLLALGLALGTLACEGGTAAHAESTPETQDQAMESKNSTSEQLEGMYPESSSDPVKVEVLTGLELPEGLEIKGKVDTSLIWRDAEGRKVLVISDLTRGEFFSEGYVSQLWANCHLWKEDGSLELLWEIKDFNQEIWESPSYINRSLRLSDVDADGVAETLFLYEIAPDGMDPAQVKLMLHVRNEKYAVRGQLGVEPESFTDVEEKRFDPKYEELAPALKEYASQEWDAYRNWLLAMLNDELSEEEIDRYRPKPYEEPE